MKNSRIEWTDHTFNPWIGCTHVSAGCANCYAEREFDHRKHVAEWGPGKPRHRTSPVTWRQPYIWNLAAHGAATPPRVFCASLADVFDPEVSDAWRDELFGLIDDCRNLHWLILTKRLDRASAYLSRWAEFDWPWRHVWLGASVEDNDAARTRIPLLLDIPAAGRFVSCEPLMAPLSVQITPSPAWAIENRSLIGVDWVIAGGESGPKARPTHPDWVRALRHQCLANDVPFLFKGWGEWAPLSAWPGNQVQGHCFPDGLVVHRVGRRNSGRLLDGREWQEVPACLR